MEELSEQDKTKEKIRFKIELFRLSIIGLISVGGGTIGIVTSGVTSSRNTFFISAGYLVMAWLVIYSYKRYNELKRLIK